MRDNREYGKDCVETAKSSSGSQRRQKVPRCPQAVKLYAALHAAFNGHSALTVAYGLYLTVFVQVLHKSVIILLGQAIPANAWSS